MLVDRPQVLPVLVTPACLCPSVLRHVHDVSRPPLWQGRLGSAEPRLCSVCLWAQVSVCCPYSICDFCSGPEGCRCNWTLARKPRYLRQTNALYYNGKSGARLVYMVRLCLKNKQTILKIKHGVSKGLNSSEEGLSIHRACLLHAAHRERRKTQMSNG